MASGSFISETGSGLEIGVEWSSVPNVNGTSKVKVDVFLAHYSIYCAALSGSYVKIGTSAHGFSKAVSKSENTYAKTYIASHEAVVTHSADGTGSVNISAGYVFNGTYGTTYVGTLKVEKTVALDFIPRASTLTCPSSLYVGTEAEIGISSHLGTNKHRIQFTVGDTDLYTGYLSGASPKITPPASLASSVTASSSALGKIILHTYNSEGKWTGQYEASVTYRIPNTDEFCPSFDVSLSPVSASSFVTERGIYAAGITKARVQVTGALAKYGAAVKDCAITVGASKYSGYTVLSEELPPGKLQVSVRVTDSRGKSRTVIRTVNVFAYCLPFVTGCDVYRCEENGIPSDTGEYLFVRSNAAFSALDGTNGAEIFCSFKKHGAEAFPEEIRLVSGEEKIIAAALSAASSYDVKLICRDSAGGETESVFLIPTAIVDMHMKNKSVRFGGYCEKSGFECNWDANFEGRVSIGEKPISDFVTEAGQSGIWTWRKWSSGISECFGNTGEAAYDVSSPWGALYYNSSGERLNSRDFPEGLFAEAPAVYPSVRRGETAPFLIPRDTPSKEHSPEYYLIYPTSGEHTVSIDLYCAGRWK